MTDTKTRYLQFRRLNTRGGRRRAIEAIALARSDKAAPTYVGKLSDPMRLFGDPYSEGRNVYGRNVYRWCYDASQAFRMAGYADEVCRTMRHEGYYISEFMDEVARGIVLQLPAKKGKPRYLAAMGFSGRPDYVKIDLQITDCEVTAASWADDMARRYAEQEREYNAVWQAARRYEETQEEIKNLRSETLALIKEIKAKLRSTGICNEVPNVAIAIRKRIERNIRNIRKARQERDQILDEFGCHSGWKEALAG